MALLSGSGTNVAMSYCVRLRCGLDPAWLWLWYMPASVAPAQPPAWELLYATGATLRYKNKEKEIIFPPKKKLLKISNLQALFHYTAFFHPKMRKNTVNYKCNIPGLGRPTWLTKHEMCLINTLQKWSANPINHGFCEWRSVVPQPHLIFLYCLWQFSHTTAKVSACNTDNKDYNT